MEEITLDLKQIAELLVTEYRKRLVDINATGNLSNSITAIEQDNDLWLSLADYWEYVENGRLPGKQPPLDAIKRWIQSKNLPQQNNLDWAIAKSIAKKGIPAKHILQDSLNEIEPELDKQLNQQIDKWISDTL